MFPPVQKAAQRRQGSEYPVKRVSLCGHRALATIYTARVNTTRRRIRSHLLFLPPSLFLFAFLSFFHLFNYLPTHYPAEVP